MKWSYSIPELADILGRDIGTTAGVLHMFGARFVYRGEPIDFTELRDYENPVYEQNFGILVVVTGLVPFPPPDEVFVPINSLELCLVRDLEDALQENRNEI